MKKRNETIRMLVLSAMFAALCCVTTMLVQFPTVAGYTNIGEGMCLLAGLVLGPWYGFFAAGIGSGLADLLAGYAHYVPGTFIIKGLVALVAALLLRPLLKKGEKIPFWRLALIELPSEVIMVAGYFGYKALILGKGLPPLHPSPIIWYRLPSASSCRLFSTLRWPRFRKFIRRSGRANNEFRSLKIVFCLREDFQYETAK